MRKLLNTKWMANGKVVPQKEEDYYIEEGKIVFTAIYLKKRGKCCQSGCRHCPYQSHKKIK